MPVSLAVHASEKSGRAAKKRASPHLCPAPGKRFSWNSSRSSFPTVLEPGTSFLLLRLYVLIIVKYGQLSFSLPLQSIQKTLNTSASSTTFIPKVITGKRPSKTARTENMMVWSPCKPRGNGCILKKLQPTLHKRKRKHLRIDGSLAYGTSRINGAGLMKQKPV